jgi:hypothetical protein
MSCVVATWLCVVAVMASPANHLGVRMTSACSVLGSTWVGAVLAAVVVGGLLLTMVAVYKRADAQRVCCCTTHASLEFVAKKKSGVFLACHGGSTRGKAGTEHWQASVRAHSFKPCADPQHMTWYVAALQV